MKIDVRKLEVAMARSCKTARQLRPAVSQQTIQRVYSGEEILPSTAGRLARALCVDPADLIETETEE